MEILKRIKAPTPKFWKKVRTLMITVGTISGVILATAATGGLAIPAAMVTIATYGATIGVVGTSLAQMTKEDVLK